jgi:hypothetical protein
MTRTEIQRGRGPNPAPSFLFPAAARLYDFSSAAWAAARRAIGTRNGLQLT